MMEFNGFSDEPLHSIDWHGVALAVGADNFLSPCAPLLEGETGTDSNKIAHSKKRKVGSSSKSGNSASHHQLHKIHRPRVPKRDSRRDYPIMFVNMCNSCLQSQYERYLDTYYAPGCSILQQNDGKYLDPIVLPEAFGLDTIKRVWTFYAEAFVDNVMSLQHAQVNLRADGTSTVTMGLVGKGTAIVSIAGALGLLRNESFLNEQGLKSNNELVVHATRTLLQLQRSQLLESQLATTTPSLTDILQNDKSQNSLPEPTQLVSKDQINSITAIPVGTMYSKLLRAIGWRNTNTGELATEYLPFVSRRNGAVEQPSPYVGIRMAEYFLCFLHLDADSRVASVQIRNCNQYAELVCNVS